MEQRQSFKEKLVGLSDQYLDIVYILVRKFPSEEKFALGDHVRRSTVSVGANIVEGFARYTKLETKRFCRISFASLAESRYLLRFTCRQKFISSSEFGSCEKTAEQISKLLYTFLNK